MTAVVGRLLSGAHVLRCLQAMNTWKLAPRFRVSKGLGLVPLHEWFPQAEDSSQFTSQSWSLAWGALCPQVNIPDTRTLAIAGCLSSSSFKALHSLAKQTSSGTFAVSFTGINKMVNVIFSVLKNVWVGYSQVLTRLINIFLFFPGFIVFVIFYSLQKN